MRAPGPGAVRMVILAGVLAAGLVTLPDVVSHMLLRVEATAAEVNAVTGAPVAAGLLAEGSSAVDSLEVAALSGVAAAPIADPYTLGGTSVSVFETFIRVVGGFLGAYDLTGNATYLGYAAAVAWELDGAFSAGPVPYPRWNLNARRGEGMPWFPAGCTSAADAGTPFFELLWLAERTGIDYFRVRGEELLRVLGAHKWVRIGSGAPCTDEVYEPGAGGDSWFEMLIKTGRRPDLVSEFLAHHVWETMSPIGPGGHLLCIWPAYVPAALLEHQCVQLATSGCHLMPEAAEMMRIKGYNMTGAAAAFASCRREYGYGDPVQHSWAVAETTRYLLAEDVCGGGIMSTEAHCMRPPPGPGCSH